MSEKYLHEMIDDIETLIDESKTAKFSPGKVIVDKDVLLTVMEELRKQIPTEVERSHKIMMNKESILEEARNQAQGMINQAAQEAGTMIEQNEIVAMAKMRVQEMEQATQEYVDGLVAQAQEEAEQIRVGALAYTKEVMDDVKSYVTSVKEAQESVFGQLIGTLESDVESISANCQELEEQLNSTSATQVQARTAKDFTEEEN